MAKRKPQPLEIANSRRGGKFPAFFRWTLFLSLALALVGGATATGIYLYFARDLPVLLSFDEHEFGGVTTLYADDGQIIAEVHEGNKGMVPYEKIPRTLILAFLATEDVRFFSHEGLDEWGILRAAIQNLQAGEVVQGGSTITQQLAKTFYLSGEKTLTRKVREAILARRMERIYTKEQILLLYLNKIYLGHNAYGIQAAARNYFRKNVWELTLGEMAMIAGLPAAPSYYDPSRNMPEALKRRNVVLRRMLERGYLNPADLEASAPRAVAEQRYTQATEEELRIYPIQDSFREKVPYFSREVLHQIPDAWQKRSLQIHTTVNIRQSLIAQKALSDGLHALARSQGWTGPLAHFEDQEEVEAFLQRADQHFEGAPKKGALAPGIITGVDTTGLAVQLGTNTRGHIPGESLSWAGPYTTFPIKKNGKRDRNGKVSFVDRKGKMKEFKGIEETFSVGDVILVRVSGAGPGRLNLKLENLPQMEGALAAFDLHAGATTVMEGGYDFDHNEVNHVDRPRPTGSTMKPIVYSKLYETGVPPSERFSGAPFTTYCPEAKEYSTPRHDDMILWDALTFSKNNISLRALWHLRKRSQKGLEDYRQWGRDLGLTLQGHCSEVLGSDQSVLDMAGAYGRFARQGQPLGQRMIRKVVASDGEVLRHNISLVDPANNTRDLLGAVYDLTEDPPPAIPADVAHLTARNMAEVTRRGTGRRAGRKFGKRFETAGKTGTLPYDVWFLGWSPRYLTGVWMGADQNERVLSVQAKQSRRNRVTGSNTPLPVWIEWMDKAHTRDPVGPIGGTTPRGISMASICPEDGKRASTGGISIPHLSGTAPNTNSQRESCSGDLPETNDDEF